MIPYNKIELSLALLALNDVDEELLVKTAEKLKPLGEKTQKEINKEVAEDNGITVAELIASPNFEKLISNFEEKKIKAIQKTLMEDLGITDKQAWAVIAAGMGLLD